MLSCVLLTTIACSSRGVETENNASHLSRKELQYFTNGKKLYDAYCSNCHTAQGTGLGRLIPPLAQSDYLLEDLSRAAIIIKYGQKGSITVNGIVYNQPMPANPKLTPLEIAEIITYVTNSWGNTAKAMTIEKVREAVGSTGSKAN